VREATLRGVCIASLANVLSDGAVMILYVI